MTSCYCGCGEETGPDKYGRDRKYIKGHYLYTGKDRYIDSEGYVRIRKMDHPNNHQGFITEHRLVMEKYLSRYLEPYEDVHHLNGNRQDNRIENLQLMSHIDHTVLTRKGNLFDMTNRRCLICRADKTFIDKSKKRKNYGRPVWHKSRGGFICHNCHNREQYRRIKCTL